ncbi:UDP-N-acetylglucosamine 2-epimerase [Gammaproteobacteria bacterium]|nr:UDP-N-acetylglucosamine 2-epimerase [Gammaproteobacteria bacterium]
MRILFVTGSRGEWGYIRPILRLIEKDPELEYELCVTNMHLLPNFGSSEEEIKNDGFEIKHRVFMSLDSYNHISQVKSLGIFLTSMADILASNDYDFIMLAGDRGEQLMGAIAGAYTYIPVGHIQAGEVSGNIDGAARHAIGKLAHVHFASNVDAEERLIKLAEEKFRVFNTGAPQVDEMVKTSLLDPDYFEKKYNFDITKEFFLVVQHPVTEEYDEAENQINTTFNVLEKYEQKKVIILPNNDAGSIAIQNVIKQRKTLEHVVFANLSRIEYLTLMRHSSLIIGNSSSGLLEAPTYNIPAVNIGRRQDGRVSGLNVIHTDFCETKIKKAIEKALSNEFKRMLEKDGFNPYGDGNSSENILKIVKEIHNMKDLTIKKLTY